MNQEPNARPKPKLKPREKAEVDTKLEITPDTGLEVTPSAQTQITLHTKLEADTDAEPNAVDFFIQGKPTQFQLDLLQLGRKLDWDENDPGFAVPLSMGQIEHVLDLYPARIKAAMEEVSRQAEFKWRAIQTDLKRSAIKGQQAADRMDNRLVQVKALLDLEMSQLQLLMQRERLAVETAMDRERKAVQKMMERERKAMLQLAQDLTAQQVDLLEQQKLALVEETKALVVRGVRTMNDQSAKEMKRIIDRAQQAYYWRSVGWACGAAFALILLTLFFQQLVIRFA